jgi:hypothetical protein
MQRRKRKSHHNKDNIQRNENQRSIAKIKNTRLTKHQHKKIYPIKIKNKLLQEEKNYLA